MEGSVQDAALLGAEDAALATRAAWLYYARGFTRSQVAEKLGIAAIKAPRPIARAARAGLVQVLVEGPIGSCIVLENRLAARFGRQICRVVPALDRPGPPLRTLGTAAAGGAEKVATVQAVLESRRLAGLITDEPTARRLISRR